MRWLTLSLLILSRACLLVGLTSQSLQASEQRSFPYEAVVSAKELYVRSGPGPRYYPTSKLQKGDKVLVQRHDPGGWYMIAPPTGSFSWIPAKHVQKLDANRGTVSANNVVVRVGSFESDIRELFQRKLSQGDEVRILSEKALPSEGGSTELWYRIEPPKSEWRWIMGKYVTVAGPGLDPSAKQSDPFISRVSESPQSSKSITLSIDTPAATTTTQRPAHDEYDPRPAATGPAALSERPLIRKSSSPKKGRPGSTEYEREEVERLDNRLQAILDQEPREWNFDQITSDYQALRETVSHEIFRNMIEGRLTLIDQKQRIRAEYQEIERLGEETLRRDAELAAMQHEHESRLLGVPRKPAPFDGAGIIQRSAGNVPNAPAYVLLGLDGRILAYLQAAPNLDLESWVGKSAGVIGNRSYQENLKTDLLVIRSVTPVRLTPTRP